MRVQLCAGRYTGHFLRQLPDTDTRWNKCEFIVSHDLVPADWLVVYDLVERPITTYVGKERRVLYVSKPLLSNEQTCSYINRFGIVVSPFPLPDYEGLQINRHASRPWSFGADPDRENGSSSCLGWSDIADRDLDGKIEALSLILPRRTATEDMSRYAPLVTALSERLGERFHLFGSVRATSQGGSDPLTRFKYHLVIEDHAIDHCWTERLADAYLAGCFPFFAGCRNLDEYFHPDAFEPIDFADAERAAERIEHLIDTAVWERRRKALLHAREDVLFRYNLPAEIERLIVQHAVQDTNQGAGLRSYHIALDHPVNRAIFHKRHRLQVRRHLEQRRSTYL